MLTSPFFSLNDDSFRGGLKYKTPRWMTLNVEENNGKNEIAESSLNKFEAQNFDKITRLKKRVWKLHRSPPD